MDVDAGKAIAIAREARHFFFAEAQTQWNAFIWVALRQALVELVEILVIDRDQFAETAQSVIEVLHLLGHNIQTERRRVLRDQHAFAVVDQAARGRNGDNVDAIVFRQSDEMIVADDLQVDQTQHHRNHQQSHAHQRHYRATGEEMGLAEMIFKMSAAGHQAASADAEAAAQAAQEHEGPRPQQSAHHARQPIGPALARLTGHALHPQHQYLLQGDEHHFAETLLPQGKDPDTAMEFHGEVGNDRKTERVLAEQGTAQHVDEQADQPGITDVAPLRQGEAPVDHHHRRPFRPQQRQPPRQRHDGEHERADYRQDDDAAAVMSTEDHYQSSLAAGAAASGQGVVSGPHSRVDGGVHTSSTSRFCSSIAIGLAYTVANDSAGLRSILSTVATG